MAAPPGVPRRLQGQVILGTWALLSGFLLLSAYHMYPAPDVDSGAFLPQAVNLARGRGLVNPLFDRAVITDPAGHGRQYFYPPLFATTVATLMPEPNARGAFVAVALLDVIALLLSAILLLRAVESSTRAGRPWMPLPEVLACLALVGLAGHMKNSAGRPEALGTVWVVAACVVAARRPSPGFGTIAAIGLLLGLTGATHPFGGVLLGIAAAGYVFVSHKGRTAGTLVLLLVATSTLTFGAVALASATDLELLFRGLARHARLAVVEAQEGVSHWRYWIAGVRFPLLGVLLVTAAAVLAGSARRHRRVIASPVALGAAVVAGIMVIGYFILRGPTRYYNLAMFAPVAYAVVISWAVRQYRSPAGSRRPAVGAALLVLLFLGTGLNLMRRVLLYPYTLREGRSWEEARMDFRRLATAGRVALVTHSLWVLSEDYDRMLLEGNTELPCRYGLFLQQQAASGLLGPPELPGHNRVFSSFTSVEPTTLGVPLASTVGGYGFAAYIPTAEQRALADCAPTR